MRYDLVTQHLEEVGTYEDERLLFKSGSHLMTRNGAGHLVREVLEGNPTGAAADSVRTHDDW